MKIINKTSVLGFIIGGILFSFLTSLAYSYNAKDISYAPSNNNWKVGNIKEAIDSIKNTNDTTISNLQESNNTKDQTIASLQNRTIAFGNTYHTTSAIKRGASNTITLDLPKGEYICSISESTANAPSTVVNHRTINVDVFPITNCDSYNELFNNNFQSISSDVLDGSKYDHTYLYQKNFVCSLNSNKTISASQSATNNSSMPLLQELACTKISIE